TDVTYAANFLKGPTPGAVADGDPGLVEVGEPTVGGALVTDLAPDAFLGIQARLVAGQVVQSEVGMRGQVGVDQQAPVPRGTIHVQMNAFPAPAVAQPPQQGE